MKVAITGASGFIGVPLRQVLLDAGHEVLTIGRAGETRPDVVWNPSAGTIDAERLGGVDAVIHLAGANIAQRWTDSAMREIRESRVKGTTLIARTLASLTPVPRVLVSMSGVGIYGDRGEESVDEGSAPGRGFLAGVAQAWEGAADLARGAGIRVVHPRLGVVLHRSGGALAKMLPIFSLGAGGPIGSGKQWLPWVGRRDVLRALRFFIETPNVSGPVDLVGPEAVRNQDFTRVLADVVHRPAIIPVPAFAVRLMFGDMGVETVLGGQRVLPRKLLAAGFTFALPTLREALQEAVASGSSTHPPERQ
ncbi:MAG: TIGR01777 family protein [Cytophagaceae bacterium]|nr:TIGR01777 family protein [Gemmatimonadaceae bacterium]